MPEVFAIARGVAIAGAEANRIALIAREMFAATRDRHGKAGPTLGASADLAMIARTVPNRVGSCVAPDDRRTASREP